MVVKFKKLHKKAVVPQYQTPGAAALDLVATEVLYEEENKVTVKFGFSSEFEANQKIRIQPRSSFTHKSWLMANSPGIIDSDYRGEWMAKFEAIPIGINKHYGEVLGFIYEPFPYKVGDRVVQATIEENTLIDFILVEELEESTRGSGGFGSTGNK